MSPNLDELIDKYKLQTLFDTFYSATGIGAAIASTDGSILVGSGWQKICYDFHRRNPDSESMCVRSDINTARKLSNGVDQAIYRCPHGLIDAATPIMVNRSHVANLFTGQFLYAPPDTDTIDAFRQQASKWRFDEKAYIEALMEVPVIPENRVDRILQYLKQLAEMIGEMGFNRLKLKERDDAIASAHRALKKENNQNEDEARKLNQILEGNPIPTFVVDSNSKITHWNRACELLTDIPAADMIGTDKHREAFYSEHRELMADLIVRRATTTELSALYGDRFKSSQIIKEGYEGEDFFPELGETGKWLFFTAAPLKNINGDIIGAIETLQDITQRRVAEQGIRASEARYRQLFESANDAIFILKDARVVDCNRKALDLFNAPRKAVLGRSPMDFSPKMQPGGASSEDEITRRISIAFQDVPQLFEWRFLRTDGSQFDAEISLTRFKIADIPHALAILRDITAQKKMIQTIKARETELDEKSRYLEKVNQALKAALDHREVEKRAVEETMLVNLKRFVFPYIEELGNCQINTDAKAYLNIIATNLNDIVSRLPNTVFSKYIDLTPTEIRIADLIRDGKNSKEMAHLLGLSPSSVQWHRKNIREKLGLTNKKINLYSYLTSLTE